jgi:hypothetical protein
VRISGEDGSNDLGSMTGSLSESILLMVKGGVEVF